MSDRDGDGTRDRELARDGGETEEYGGLVRDRIPELIRERGRTPETHVADGAEFAHLLGEKLVEEAEEYAEDGDVEDLADVLAVVGVVCGAKGIDRDELERVGQERMEELGAFDERIVLERVRE